MRKRKARLIYNKIKLQCSTSIEFSCDKRPDCVFNAQEYFPINIESDLML